MTVHIVARHVKLTKPLKDFIQERLDKLQHYFDNIIWAQAILSVEKKVQSAEIVIHTAKQTFKSGAKSADLYSSVDMAADKMEVQIKKFKEKLKDHRVSEEQEMPMTDTVMPAASSEIKFSVVKQVPVHPMTADDAAFEMERMGYNFWMFLDESTKKVNVIFKRQDSTYGLLQPIKKN